MSMRRLPPDVYKNLKKLELSANTKSGALEETVILKEESDDDDPTPYYWFVIMLSFGQRSGYIYDREGLHIPEPDEFLYSIELWRFRGSQIKQVETIISKVGFDEAVKTLNEEKQKLEDKGYESIDY